MTWENQKDDLMNLKAKYTDSDIRSLTQDASKGVLFFCSNWFTVMEHSSGFVELDMVPVLCVTFLRLH